MKSVALSSVTVAFQVHRMLSHLSQGELRTASLKVFTEVSFLTLSNMCLRVTTVYRCLKTLRTDVISCSWFY